MSTELTTAELRRRTAGAQLRIDDHLQAALEDVADAIKYAPAPMTRDQFGAIELRLREALEMLRLVVV